MKTLARGDVVSFFHQPELGGDVVDLDAEVVDLREDGKIDLAVRVSDAVTMNKSAVPPMGRADFSKFGSRPPGHWALR